MLDAQIHSSTNEGVSDLHEPVGASVAFTQLRTYALTCVTRNKIMQELYLLWPYFSIPNYCFKIYNDINEFGLNLFYTSNISAS